MIIPKTRTGEPIKVCVDIGHNIINDNGASDLLDENTCTREIGEQLIAILQNWGYDVFKSLTNADIEYLNTITDVKTGVNESLRLRAKNSNDNGANLFVSIHLNANDSSVPLEKKGRGAAAYAITEQERTLGNYILKYICNQHYDLGPDEFLDGTKRTGLPFPNRRVTDGRGLYVIKNTEALGVLVECCFIDHPMDAGLYKDESPYINHEETQLEEGVMYRNSNVFNKNFFAYCIAKGIDDFCLENTLEDMDKISEFNNCNYVCYTNCDQANGFKVKIDKSGYEELVYGKRVLSLLRKEKIDEKYYNKLYLTYSNVNVLNTDFGKQEVFDLNNHSEDTLRNLGYLGIMANRNDRLFTEFKLRRDVNIYKSDGSFYFIALKGSTVGIDSMQFVPDSIYERRQMGMGTMMVVEPDGNNGPVVCEPTRPNWIKINYIIRAGTTEVEQLYNVFNGDDFAWAETNLNKCQDLSTFDFITKI